MDTHTFRELLPTIGSYGRRCDHPDAWTGIRQWNGLTYCIHCCEHNFGHKNFVFNLGDGFNTCTLCFRVVGRHIRMLYREPSGSRRKAGPKPKPKLPRVTLTDPNGVRRRVNKG